MPGWLLHIISVASGLIVLAEAFNKLERTDLWEGRARTLLSLGWLLVPWRWTRQRIVLAMKLLAWASLAVGSAGMLISFLTHRGAPQIQDVAFAAGFALLIVRSRIKEG